MTTTPTPDLRDRLLAAADAELVEHGPGRISLRAVARRAGVSHAAPAYCFGDRAGLLTAVVARAFRDLAAALAGPLPAGRPVAAVLGERYVAFARERPAVYDLMFRPEDLRPADPDLAAARGAALAPLVAATADDHGAPTALTLVAWALAHGAATLGAQGAIDVVAPGTSPADLVGTFAELLGDGHP